MSQSGDKVMYFANNKGLLEFNGANWTLFPSPNESIVRSVKVIGNRIYTGSYMEFGYWEKDEFGVLNYKSLSSRFYDQLVEDEEFWEILELNGLLVFQSLKRLYLYDLGTESIQSIEPGNIILHSYKVGNNVYFQVDGHGLYKVDNGSPTLVSQDKILREDELINIFPNGPGLTLMTKQNGFFSFQNKTLKKLITDLDNFPSKLGIYSGIQTKNGNYAVGTISNGLFILDGNGNLLMHFNRYNGLGNNTILSIHEDMDDNIWAGLDNGISYININSPISVYNDNKGIVGSIYATVLHDGILYLGTNQGLFYRKYTDDTADFKLMGGTKGQVWSLQEVGGVLFCGHHAGTFVVEKDRAIKVADVEGTWKVNPLPGNPNLLLQGNYNGLFVLQKQSNTWKIRNKIEGFDNSSRHFETIGNQIFVNHEYKGLFKLTTDESFKRILQTSIDTLIKGSESALAKHQENLYYAYKKGVLQYMAPTGSFVIDSLLSQAYSAKDYVSGRMVTDRSENLWMFSNAEISVFSNGFSDEFRLRKTIPLTQDSRNDIIGYENVASLGEQDTYIMGTTFGYLKLDLNKFRKPSFSVQIGKVEKSGMKHDWYPLETQSDATLNSTENNIKVSYFAAEYNKFFPISFQYKLEGFYDDWSDWSTDYSVTFENLPFGDYTFKVRAKIGDTVSTNIASHSLTIARPWYISNLMILLYVFTFVIGSYLIHQAYRRYYHKRQQKLIEENRREMELAKVQNEREIVKIKNEQLKKQYRSKSNELAASTLSIIHKNELLSKIKDQLLAKVGEKEPIKPIIAIIDKSMTKDSDWELFKEAFKNADRRFLKKLKKVHPNLSPNDVRLCAYLRLNLSSKEIAPLFNISVRSVEIKRYRLRKKMGLEHDDNLVDYILQL